MSAGSRLRTARIALCSALALWRYVVVVPFHRLRYRGVAPLMAAGSSMSPGSREQWRDEHTWEPSLGSDLVLQSDLAPASWIEPLLVPVHGPHPRYAEFQDNPNYWWPEDRAWCVLADTDLDWAYLAGSVACVEE